MIPRKPQTESIILVIHIFPWFSANYYTMPFMLTTYYSNLERKYEQFVIFELTTVFHGIKNYQNLQTKNYLFKFYKGTLIKQKNAEKKIKLKEPRKIQKFKR